MTADSAIQSRLADLRSDYFEVTGEECRHFVCPILHRDDCAVLCEGHIVNQSFSSAPRLWVPQRKDVDNFFGSQFEADFVKLIRYRELGDPSPERVFADDKLSKQYNPEISLNGRVVPHFKPTGPVPPQYSAVRLDLPSREIDLGLKIAPDELMKQENVQLEFSLELDARLPAVVSLIKAAHLTLFEMLGYRYALSSGGYFVGRQVLGDFYLQTQSSQRSEIQSMAVEHFREFVAMVRPVHNPVRTFQGTTTDRRLLLCEEGRSRPWAFIVFVNTGCSMHAVLMPHFEAPGLVAKYFDFLRDETESIEVRFCEYRDGAWQASPDISKQHWPKTGVLYP